MARASCPSRPARPRPRARAGPGPRRAVSESASTSTSRMRVEVERDDGAVRAPRCGVDAADDAGAAAERHDRDAARGASLEHRGDLRGVGGRRRPRRARLDSVAAAQPDQVGIALAGRAADPVLVARSGRASPAGAPRRRPGSGLAGGQPHLLELDALARLGVAELARAASRARPRRARAACSGSPQPHHFIGRVTGPAHAAGSPQRALDARRAPRRGGAGRPAHHRRAEPREAAQALVACELHARSRSAPPARASSSSARLRAGCARTACPSSSCSQT